ncbi:MAG: hypothetical protein SGPRY_007457, partial [Prymnesium sp.]
MRSSFARRSSDVLSILVNIYGSKTLFVNEFRAMLADKLLASSHYETDNEVRNVELLKKRFGDDALKSCEAPRKLLWKPSLGSVTLDVSFSDCTVKDVSCSPLHATILHHFAQRPAWSLSSLSAEMGIRPELLRKRMALWLNRGFIVETSRTAEETNYEAPATLGSTVDARHQAVEEEENPAESAKEEALAQFEAQAESYVIGMLTNLDTLPLARIHNMLKMFLSSEDHDFTEAELRRFLSR